VRSPRLLGRYDRLTPPAHAWSHPFAYYTMLKRSYIILNELSYPSPSQGRLDIVGPQEAVARVRQGPSVAAAWQVLISRVRQARKGTTMQSRENQATPPEDAPLLALTDKELAAISGACSSGSSSGGSYSTADKLLWGDMA
jgi:hypothetical protein